MDSRVPLKVAGIAAQRKIGLKRFGPFELLQYLSLVASLRAGHQQHWETNPVAGRKS
jgi:hypothetical protein